MSLEQIGPLIGTCFCGWLAYLVFFQKSKASDEIRAKAEKGDVPSMLQMAKASESTKEKVLWFGRAADAGSALGMFYYADYLSVLPDRKEEAFGYYLKAAEQGIPEAMAEVAKGYDNGNGVLKNIASAVEWRERAAKKGHKESQVELAKALFKGDGRTYQPEEGLAWLYLAEHNQAPGATELVEEFEAMARSLPAPTPNNIILAAQNRAKELLAENPDAVSKR